MSAEPVDPEELGFAAAMAELDRIVVELESDALDVDRLADRVARAAQLVDWCRDRIDTTRFQVERVVARLDAPTGDQEDDIDDEDDED